MEKVFYKSYLSLNVPWDESLPVELLKEWHLIVDQLTEISEFKIPRIAGDINGGESYQLLIFCDASGKAYAVIVYLRCKNGAEFHTYLLYAKMQLVPVGKRSSAKALPVPRLELLATLFNIWIANYIVKELRVNISEKIL